MRVAKPERTIDFPAVEKEVLQKWESENCFRRSIDERPFEKSYNFYDGPPFATGLPHFGHFLPSSIKDAFPRYFTMRGRRVERRFGWDCHGLPVEMLVQKELGLNGRAEIEDFGIAKFNEACRDSVLRYTTQWREYMRRLGRWVDMDNEYRTMDKPFMESVWSLIKSLFEKGFIYEGRQVMSFSSALSSTLSNFEASLDYRDIQDPSVTLKAKLGQKFKGKNLLVWTTTPWTMPANVAVAIDAKGTYAEVQEETSGEIFIVLESRVSSYWPEEQQVKILRTFLGAELEGVPYEPFFDSYISEAGPNAFRVYGVGYVDHATGTGAVHTAPAFGEDDFHCAKEHNLPILDHLDANGRFLPTNITEIVGLEFKEGDKPIMSYLKQKGFVFKHDTFVHAYPFCYRSGKPLMFRAMPSWFVKVESIKDKLQASNTQINWVPEHIKAGRFGKWLENARDWNIARARFWGNPIPIWKNDETGELICIGSVGELEAMANRKIEDIHMEFIDDIEFPAKSGKGVFKRVPFVLDCWFESGAMPYAQLHYPFENEENFSKLFPADFICEGLDQTRGWFYTLNVLSTALWGMPAFKNVVVNGMVMASDGKKMSKSLKNYADPMETLDTLGADSVRLFLLNSPGTAAEEVRFSIEGVKENTRKVLLPLWNAYSFFATYASIDGFDPETHLVKSTNDLDVWILLRQRELIAKLDEAMNTYHNAKAVPCIVEFLDDLNNWYIRRSRRRFWGSCMEAHSTLYNVLVTVTQALAPFAPFASEAIFQKLSLTKELQQVGSVHLSLLPAVNPLSASEEGMLRKVALARRVVELGRNIRTQHKLKNRQPLQRISVGLLSTEHLTYVEELRDVILQELNVKELTTTLETEKLAQIVVKPNFKTLGKSLGDKIKTLQTELQSISQKTAVAALKGETIHVGEFELTSAMVNVELKGAGKELVATDADLVVALDPTITDELRMEGLAREMVSLVQKARKSADFEVEDKIELFIQGTDALQVALNANLAYLEEETLSNWNKNLPSELAKIAELKEGQHFQQDVETEGIKLTLFLRRKEK